eukprot:GEMP01012994.1.p1 GENE.GEMP01012994.1~~GEMP01012994.1.p1  ORF type:complete len:253 (+),score=45.06 GEMP01012994.1:22-780(+)
MLVVFYILSLLAFGSLNTLTTKWQFTMTSEGLDGVKVFQKPWWGNFAMFFAMSLVLTIYYTESVVQKRREKNKVPDNRYNAMVNPERASMSQWKTFSYIGIPAVLDLIGSGLTLVGLLYISASVWQMLRGSNIVFAAFLSMPLLRRTLHPYHWIGVSLCVIGICCVGFACVMGGLEKSNHAGLRLESYGQTTGCLLVLAGQFVQAGQVVAEEKLLKDVHLPGMLIVGYEGLWGSLLMLFVCFPLFHGRLERV